MLSALVTFSRQETSSSRPCCSQLLSMPVYFHSDALAVLPS